MCHTCLSQGLALYNNKIGDAGVTALAKACAGGALAQLETLSLRDNQIGDAGIEALAKACASGALPQCTRLQLAGNQIGDAGIIALADACAMGAMAQLKVCWLPIALSPCREIWHVCSPGLTVLFDVPYVPCAEPSPQ